MEELHGNLNSNGFFREFLKLTGAGMRIVVSGLKEEGKPVRWSSGRVVEQLDAIQKKHLSKEKKK